MLGIGHRSSPATGISKRRTEGTRSFPISSVGTIPHPAQAWPPEFSVQRLLLAETHPRQSGSMSG